MDTITDRLVSWASLLEDNTPEQALTASRLPFVFPHLALMPDAHLGLVSLDEHDRVWALLHSGSRGVGNKVEQHHIAVARQLLERCWIQLLVRVRHTLRQVVNAKGGWTTLALPHVSPSARPRGAVVVLMKGPPCSLRSRGWACPPRRA